MPLQQDYSFQSVRSSAVLTNSYVAGAIVIPGLSSLEQYNQITLYVNFTIGSLTSASLKIEFSDDNTNWYQETIDAVDTSTGIITEKLATRQLGGSGSYRIPVKTIDRWIRVSAIGTGTVTGSLLSINSVIGLVV